MFASVAWHVATSVSSGDPALKTLVTAVGLGACTYCGLTYALWRLARRPPGAEMFIVSSVEAAFHAIRSRAAH